MRTPCLVFLLLLTLFCRAGDLPAFKTDQEADGWLRGKSPYYAMMAKDMEKRGGYKIRNGDHRLGMYLTDDGQKYIELNPEIKGALRVSVIIFELTNAFQEVKHIEIDQRVRDGAIKNADVFALRHEMIEYDGLRYHRFVLAELDKLLGGIPREMLTWLDPGLSNLDGYHLPLAHDYLEAQEKGGHTAHYRKYFPLRQAEKPVLAK